MECLNITTFIILFLCSCTPPTRNEQSPDNAQNEASKIHVIEIKQMKFEPAEINVRKGDQVRWINKDITNHDVTEESKKAWASSPLSTGQSWTLVVTESVDYYCDLHQVMKGKIIVE